MYKNLKSILWSLLDDKFDLLDLRDKFGIFDQSYCPLMQDNVLLNHIVEKEWDTYRDLNLVF
jgi:hypothetical protein